MKKLIVIASSLLATGIVLYGVYNLSLKRTPESVLKAAFSISLKGFDYSVGTFEEQWHPNGDGHTLVIYKFNKLTQENIDYLKGFGLKSLPVSEEDCELMIFNKIPKKFFKSDQGYYIYKPESAQDTDYKVFIVNIEKKIAVLYYQYM